MAESQRPTLCGICFAPFIQIDETIWMGVCEHRSGVIARIGTEKPKKAPKEKRMTMEEYNNNKEKDEIKTKGKGKGKKKAS